MTNTLENFPIYAGFAAKIYEDMGNEISAVGYAISESTLEGLTRKVICEALACQFWTRAKELENIAKGASVLEPPSL